jgi:hypothetical protein
LTKELKNDFGARQMPCGDFNANALYFDICSLSCFLYFPNPKIEPPNLKNPQPIDLKHK